MMKCVLVAVLDLLRMLSYSYYASNTVILLTLFFGGNSSLLCFPFLEQSLTRASLWYLGTFVSMVLLHMLPCIYISCNHHTLQINSNTTQSTEPQQVLLPQSMMYSTGGVCQPSHVTYPRRLVFFFRPIRFLDGFPADQMLGLGLAKDFFGQPVFGLRLGFRCSLSFRMLRSSYSFFSKRSGFQLAFSLALR